MTDPRILRTRQEVADHFGVQPKQITVWKRQGMPGGPGYYDLDKIEHWKRTRPKDHRADSEEDKDLKEQLLAEKVRLERARADIEERKNSLQEGRFIEAHLLENFVSRMNSQIRDDLLRIPAEMQSGFPREHRAAIVESMQDRLRLFLSGLAAWQRRVTEIEQAEPRGPGRPKKDARDA